MKFSDYLHRFRTDHEYHTAAGTRWPIVSLPGIRRLFFYSVFIYSCFATVWWILRGMSAQEAVMRSSFRQIWALERVGGIFHISGLNHVAEADGAVVLSGNHMSSLETLALPSLVMPFRPCSFVVKDALMHYPLFGRILRELGALPVSRNNARADLQQVLKQGKTLLQEGTSLVIFPQSTRRTDFDGKHFGSLGAKLARSADVQLIPVALKTDMMVNGKVVKDICGLDPSRHVYFAFGPAMTVEGKGREEHEQCVAFIGGHVDAWTAEEQRRG